MVRVNFSQDAKENQNNLFLAENPELEIKEIKPHGHLKL
tara:strand:+ start:2500 stop:2616 length:117 start_codon:yes stop_codon:yes gene_type:complete